MFWLAELVLGCGFVLGVGGTIVIRELCRRPLARQPVRPVVREPMWEPPPLTRSEWLPTGALIPAEALIPEDDRARAWVADHLMYVYAIVMEDEQMRAWAVVRGGGLRAVPLDAYGMSAVGISWYWRLGRPVIVPPAHYHG